MPQNSEVLSRFSLAQAESCWKKTGGHFRVAMCGWISCSASSRDVMMFFVSDEFSFGHSYECYGLCSCYIA